MEEESILNILPEDILAIILSRHGLHPSLGSTCKRMRQLSLSEKCIGSVCVIIGYSNRDADPAFLPYKHVYHLNIRRKLSACEKLNYYLIGDYTWPYLTMVDSEWPCFIDYRNEDPAFPSIYAPRLIELKTSFGRDIISALIEKHQHVKERIPLFVPNIECFLTYQDDLTTILRESHKGLKIKTCYFDTAFPRYNFNFDSHMKDIILQYPPIKFIETAHVGSFLFRSMDDKLLHYLLKITHKCIKITIQPLLYIPGAYGDSDIELIFTQIKMIHDMCYERQTTTNTEKYISIKYLLRFHVHTDHIQIYKNIVNMYPKITLSQIKEGDPDYGYNSYHVLFRYPCDQSM